ncbi:MAG: nucleoside phosphorylase [bacterium]
MKASELVLVPDGSLYHIRLTGNTLADKVLLVGDPRRVNMFKEVFDRIEFESENREIHALTGSYHGTRMTALSTGMGCDNIDIVMTELDAALRVDNGKWKAESDRELQLIRIGTSGSLQADIDCGSHVASAYAIGLDGLMNYYKEWIEEREKWKEMEEAFLQHMGLDTRLARPYCVQGSKLLLDKIAFDMHHGITATAPGFYGPQGRTIRLHPSIENLNDKLASFVWKVEREKWKVTNLEMETSAIYGFSHLMGHAALTVCLIIANRPKGTFLNDYHPQMRELVGTIVERMK